MTLNDQKCTGQRGDREMASGILSCQEGVGSYKCVRWPAWRRLAKRVNGLVARSALAIDACQLWRIPSDGERRVASRTQLQTR